ncbi:MAG: hypothetical protein ACJ790_06410 [Myxococcaceae bacterium]
MPVGDHATFSVDAPNIPICDDIVSQPTSASAEVIDPDNREVAVTVDFVSATEGTTEGNGTAHANVSFSAARAGIYHVVVSFQPAGGNVQLDVLAIDPLAAPMITLPERCANALRMPNAGTYVCDGRLFSRSGQPMGTLPLVGAVPVTAALVAEGKLWGASGSALLRYAEVDSGVLAVDASGDTGVAWSAAILVPSEQSAVAFAGSSLFRISVDGGEIVSQRVEESLPIKIDLGVRAFQEGNRIFAAGVAATGDSLVSCAWELAEDGGVTNVQPDGGCVALPYAPVGAQKDGIWGAPGQGRLDFLVPIANGELRSQKFPVEVPTPFRLDDTAVQIFPQTEGRPTYLEPGTGMWLAPFATQSGTIFKYLQLPAGAVLRGNDSVLWYSTDAGTFVFDAK